MSLKNKVISGLSWNFIENISKYGLTFIIGIILARLLSPEEFGLVAMITVFTALSQSFIDSGFGGALIRKKSCSQNDYSTVFYYNLLIGIILFITLFCSAGAISRFYNEPELIILTKVMAVTFIINSFGFIQRIILIKRIDFKLKTKISVIASLISGITGIILAYNGWGVWSLVIRTLTNNLLNVLLLWFWNRWIPTLVFSIESFKELFGFGIRYFATGMINTIYNNIFLLIIGKYFSAGDLGFYTRADKFKSLPSANLSGIVSQVSFPALASIQDQPEKLKKGYQDIIRSTMFLSFVLMIGMAAVSEAMILTLIGSKWAASIQYLQLLCFVGMFHPLHALNLNMLAIKNKPGLLLRLEIIKKILIIPVILIGIKYGIMIMITGMLIYTIICYFLNSFWSGKFIGYSVIEQISDILPSLILALVMGGTVYVVGLLLPYSNIIKLFIQLIVGGGLTFFMAEVFRLKSYQLIKQTASEKWKNRKK